MDKRPTLAYWIGREFDVWIIGLAAGIPLVHLLALWRAYTSVTLDGTASWDKGRAAVYYTRGARHQGYER